MNIVENLMIISKIDYYAIFPYNESIALHEMKKICFTLRSTMKIKYRVNFPLPSFFYKPKYVYKLSK